MKDCLTGRDNMTYDASKFLGAIAFICYIALAVYNSYKGTPWSAADISGGISAMAVAFGINLRLKHPTEPEDKKEEDK